MPAKNRTLVPEDTLTQMQWYLGEETIEDYQDGIISRRAMLKRLIVICGGSAAAATVLAACGIPPTAAMPTPTGTPADEPEAAPTLPPATSAPAMPTAEATSASAATTTASGPVLSVAADDPAVITADITYRSDGEVMAYLARPSTEGVYPGVIVIHENRGLTDHIKDVARRLAKAGYVALAPDLVSRMGGTASMAPDQIAGVLGSASPDDLVKDLNAGVDFLLAQDGVKPDKVGVVGFCFGGAYTLRLAAANPKVAAAVPYYGVTPEPASQLANTNAAILGQYGENDARVNNTIPALEETMRNAGKIFEKHIYAGAGHAFNNDTGARYNEAAAVLAWQRTLDWFAKYLR